MNTHDLISTLGFPIVAALGAAGGVWVLIRWLTKSISMQIETSRQETLSQFRELHTIQIRLIDRVRSLEGEILRTHVLVATIHELRIPLERLGRRSEKGE